MSHRFFRAVPVVMLLLTIALLLTAIPPTARGRQGSPSSAAREAAWTQPLATVEQAVGAGNVSMAARAWHDAYVAAVASRSWEGMLAVGDASLRIGEISGAASTARAKARENYLAALVRARAAGSVDGVLRAAQAFDALGDREVVRACLRIANEIVSASGDDEQRARVRAVMQRLSAHATGSHS